MASDIVAEVNKALTEYCVKVQRALDDAAKEAAELTQRQLKANSPKKAKGKGRGRYARGWRIKKREIAGLVSYTVYNGTQPGLTHTLEHGHLARNQYGTYGRVRPIKHIEPAEEQGIQRFELSARARMRSVK